MTIPKTILFGCGVTFVSRTKQLNDLLDTIEMLARIEATD